MDDDAWQSRSGCLHGKEAAILALLEAAITHFPVWELASFRALQEITGGNFLQQDKKHVRADDKCPTETQSITSHQHQDVWHLLIDLLSREGMFQRQSMSLTGGSHNHHVCSDGAGKFPGAQARGP